MNAIENDVKELVFKELNNANKQFPLFNSPHQGYGVIKKNETVFEQMRMVKLCAEQVAIEAIQVAAMCDKYNMSLAGENADHCVMCGEIIPEGSQVCYTCKTKGGDADGKG